MKPFLAILLALLVSLCGRSAENSKPNVIIILADDLGSDLFEQYAIAKGVEHHHATVQPVKNQLEETITEK